MAASKKPVSKGLKKVAKTTAKMTEVIGKVQKKASKITAASEKPAPKKAPKAYKTINMAGRTVDAKEVLLKKPTPVKAADVMKGQGSMPASKPRNSLFGRKNGPTRGTK